MSKLVVKQKKGQSFTQAVSQAVNRKGKAFQARKQLQDIKGKSK